MAVSLATRCKATWQIMRLNADLFLEGAELQQSRRGLLPGRARLSTKLNGGRSEKYR